MLKYIKCKYCPCDNSRRDKRFNLLY